MGITWIFWAWDAWWQDQLASCQRRWNGCSELIEARGRLAMLIVFWGLASVLAHFFETHSAARSSSGRALRVMATGKISPASDRSPSPSQSQLRATDIDRDQASTRLSVVLAGDYSLSSSPLVQNKPFKPLKPLKPLKPAQPLFEKTHSKPQELKKPQEAMMTASAGRLSQVHLHPDKEALLSLVSPASLPASMASGTGGGNEVSSGLWKEEGQSESFYLARFQEDLLALPLKGGCTVQMRAGLSPLLEACDDAEDAIFVIDLIARYGPLPGQDTGQFFFLGFSGSGSGGSGHPAEMATPGASTASSTY
jgi:hypothetical protein